MLMEDYGWSYSYTLGRKHYSGLLLTWDDLPTKPISALAYGYGLLIKRHGKRQIDLLNGSLLVKAASSRHLIHMDWLKKNISIRDFVKETLTELANLPDWVTSK